MFMPVPPNISLPMTTPKEVAMASCQSGMVGGTISGTSRPVTRNPSLTSCLRTIAKIISHTPPTT